MATGSALATLLLLAGTASAQGAKPLKRCAADAVIAGTVCMDTYEASVWRVPNSTTANVALVKRIQQGKATAAALTASGATQLGIGSTDDYAPCGKGGQNCVDDIYAVSLPGVAPSANITWSQAHAASANAGKRLPTNAEWQAAVLGTPDPGPDDGTTDCNSSGVPLVFTSLTGSRSGCRSARGAFDMVGNVAEWVADWVQNPTVCDTWGSSFSPTGDHACFSGASDAVPIPAALMRGGFFANGSTAGPLWTEAVALTEYEPYYGFRCAR